MKCQEGAVMRLILIWSAHAPPHVKLFKISKTLFSIEVAGTQRGTMNYPKEDKIAQDSLPTH